jgi:hypothetical protein
MNTEIVTYRYRKGYENPSLPASQVSHIKDQSTRADLLPDSAMLEIDQREMTQKYASTYMRSRTAGSTSSSAYRPLVMLVVCCQNYF